VIHPNLSSPKHRPPSSLVSLSRVSCPVPHHAAILNRGGYRSSDAQDYLISGSLPQSISWHTDLPPFVAPHEPSKLLSIRFTAAQSQGSTPSLALRHSPLASRGTKAQHESARPKLYALGKSGERNIAAGGSWRAAGAHCSTCRQPNGHTRPCVRVCVADGRSGTNVSNLSPSRNCKLPSPADNVRALAREYGIYRLWRLSCPLLSSPMSQRLRPCDAY